MNQNKGAILGVWVALILTLTLNYLSNALPINGQNAGQVSAKYATYFTPAGFAFSIWGVIYTGFIAFAIFQSLRPQWDNPRLVAARPWVIVNGLLNSMWLPLFHYEQMGWALVVIVGLLFSLIQIHRALRPAPAGWQELWLARVPFGIYLGWLCVATVANASIFLDSIGWSGWGLPRPLWAMVMIVVATLVAAVFHLRFRDWAFWGVFPWALTAIYQKQQGVEGVPQTALFAIGLLGLVALLIVLASQQRRSPVARP